MAIPWLQADSPLPPTSWALDEHSEAPGLLAAGGGLAIARLRNAYSNGVFPWYSPGQPVLWWSPDPRMLLRTRDFRLSHSLRKTLRRFLRAPGCELRFDHDPLQVMAHCAQTPREGQDGTWIVPEMQMAYGEWARHGDVHSVETWVDGELVGGLYGVTLGRTFFGESMFHRARDASKVALVHLVARLRAGHYRLLDTQFVTDHLRTFGAVEVTRPAYHKLLDAALVGEGDFGALALDHPVAGSIALAQLAEK